PQEVRKVTFDADAARSIADARWTIPAEFGGSGMLVFERMSVPLKADTAFEAIHLGIVKTHQFMAQVYLTIARLFQGTVKPSHLRGPVGIVHEGSRIAQRGWTYLMFFLGLISVNLVVI